MGYDATVEAGDETLWSVLVNVTSMNVMAAVKPKGPK